MNFSEWLIPFKSRGSSGCCDLNFLHRQGKMYVMDNHRAALWCWLRHLPNQGKISIIHIDRHTDCNGAHLDEWQRRSDDLDRLSLDEYLSRPIDQSRSSSCLYTWDNFLAIFLRRYRHRIAKVFFATRQGSPPEMNPLQIDEEILPSTILHLAKDPAAKSVIVDLDLDYFVASMAHESHIRLYSNEYTEAVLVALKQLIESPHCICTTIALSPECCGGWTAAEELLSLFCRHIGCQIALPATPDEQGKSESDGT